MTHEEYIERIRESVASRCDDSLAKPLRNVKLVYGVGKDNTRGRTVFEAWRNGHPTHRHDVIEICAIGEESPVQLAGTVVHELAHVIAGPGEGHSGNWRAIAQHLGLKRAVAAGQNYQPGDLDDHIRVEALGVTLTDGRPVIGASTVSTLTFRTRPCSAGIGTRGGKSRGTGSGSRLRKWQCPCGVIARVASDDFRASCTRCGSAFNRA